MPRLYYTKVLNMPNLPASNTLFYGDNLPILREHIPSMATSSILRR